jgi:PKD repeat protein
VVPCITATPSYGPAPLAVNLDASCSVFLGTAQSYAWNFGDGGTGSGKTADHVYGAPGDYTVTLTATDTDAYSASTQRVVRVYEPVTSFSDDFERLDGTVGGWTTAAGTWSLLGGLLATGPTATVQPTLYAGSPVKSLPRNTTFQWQQSFLAPGSNATVGRHAGLLLGANLPFTRTANQFAGYLVDWIDRASDRGVRLSRIDPGPVNVTLAAKPATAPAQPPLNWRVEIEDDHIRVYGDDVLYHDVVDSTYRGGVFGFWAHETAQEVRFDNLVVTSRPVTAYIDISASPTMPVFVTTPVRLSAALSEVIEGSIASYEWNFGDGTTGAGLEVEHTYPVPDPYTVTLTVTTDGGLNDQATKDLTARSLYADCFGRAAGPVDGWTVSSGEWLITEAGKLTKSPSATENFAWAGVPAEMFGGDFAVELDFVFGDTATTSPFQHGGIMFYASEPTHRYATGIDGYTFDWIKRDNAYRLLRVDNAVHVPLVTATEVSGVPATRWRLEVVGDTIRVFGNGVQILEAVDATYRKGHFGLWAFSNNQSLVIDNVSIPPSAPAACKVELTCSVTDEDPPRLNVQAVAGTVGCMPAGCTCAAMDILVDGTVVGTLTPDAAGAAQGAFPLPDPCAPGSTHVVSARCAATGPEATPEATCEFICPTPAGGLQRPGDCNQDAKMDISDGICIFGHLFLGNPSELACGDKTIGAPGNVTMLDHNGDAKIDISDGISLLSFLFQGGPPPVVGTACLRIVGCSDPPVECVDP